MSLRPIALTALLLAPPGSALGEPAPEPPEASRPPTGEPGDAGAPDAGATVPGGLFTVAGKIGSVDPAHGRFTLEAPEGTLDLGVDRNTSVYLAKGMGTLRSLEPGLPVRACYGGADKKVFWVEVHLEGVMPGRAGLEVKPPAAAPATPQAAGLEGDKGAAPADTGAARTSGMPPQPGPGRTTPGPKSGG